MLDVNERNQTRMSRWIAALEEACRGLDHDSTESHQAIRRIAHTLRNSGAPSGFPGMADALRLVETAREDDIGRRTGGLLDALRSALKHGGTDRAGILIIEDDPDMAAYLQEFAGGPDRDVFTARTAAEAEATLERRNVSLILLDLILPDTDGRNLLVRIRERVALAHLPIIVLTVKGTARVRAECLALGADAFVEKPVGPERLDALVALHLRRGSDTRLLRGMDRLTGLPTRATLIERFRKVRAAARELQEPVTLSLFNFDRFKAVNSAHGRKMGDQIYRRAAILVHRSLRATDILGRWGNGQFLVLMPATDAFSGMKAMKAALSALRAEAFPTGKLHPVRLTFSAGVTRLGMDLSLDDAILEAERMLFMAKETGRDKVLLSRPADPHRYQTILLVEDTELIRMVAKNQLEKAGYEVVAVEDGKRALLELARTRFSLVVTDIQMPRMNGFELIAHLRATGTFAKMPVILATSLGNEEDVVRGFELGADDYIQKPFKPLELVGRVRRLLRKGREDATTSGTEDSESAKGCRAPTP